MALVAVKSDTTLVESGEQVMCIRTTSRSANRYRSSGPLMCSKPQSVEFNIPIAMHVHTFDLSP